MKSQNFVKLITPFPLFIYKENETKFLASEIQLNMLRIYSKFELVFQIVKQINQRFFNLTNVSIIYLQFMYSRGVFDKKSSLIDLSYQHYSITFTIFLYYQLYILQETIYKPKQFNFLKLYQAFNKLQKTFQVWKSPQLKYSNLFNLSQPQNRSSILSIQICCYMLHQSKQTYTDVRYFIVDKKVRIQFNQQIQSSSKCIINSFYVYFIQLYFSYIHSISISFFKYIFYIEFEFLLFTKFSKMKFALSNKKFYLKLNLQFSQLNGINLNKNSAPQLPKQTFLSTSNSKEYLFSQSLLNKQLLFFFHIKQLLLSETNIFQYIYLIQT
ncbi:transmembrane protein, putative (macronuclear) [Tetrahymena thermophila SB210]|uniref:Transmembrane protein, putative n=1 Tax=Tetrahymena thermophila (strain SB210) TaxID=312017 RepID=W7XGW9_TETTS|nr:transmembrane protein, putative [Tetrahymena thermophila SB210]EWS73516.1 transmembrane protein, putative [Tetrahymena thermophila SB210]|eukprot:XP_012653941.1 transmembrane protein, putative [Tetrahymena thermophila SB210]